MEPNRLTGGEWNIMACLWQSGPLSSMQLVELLRQRVGWAKSTTITTLQRMEGKGLVSVQTVGRGRIYTPLLGREEAVVAETHSFLDRVYQGSVGLMMSAMVQRQELSGDDLEQLRAILDQAEGRKDE